MGIQADGNVVPCCLAYDDTISIGNINLSSLQGLLNNNKFLDNLRKVGGEKHITCQKCFGEPTKRGVIIRNFLNFFLHKF